MGVSAARMVFTWLSGTWLSPRLRMPHTVPFSIFHSRVDQADSPLYNQTLIYLQRVSHGYDLFILDPLSWLIPSRTGVPKVHCGHFILSNPDSLRLVFQIYFVSESFHYDHIVALL